MKKLLLILLTLGTTTLAAQCGTNSYYSGGYSTSQCAPNRVRWEVSSCGTFRWCINESSYWIPGQWVYLNGCRTWNDGYYGWNCVNRSRVYNNHVCNNVCGHGGPVYVATGNGGYYNGNGYSNGGYYGNGGHHGGHGHGGYNGGYGHREEGQGGNGGGYNGGGQGGNGGGYNGGGQGGNSGGQGGNGGGYNGGGQGGNSGAYNGGGKVGTGGGR